MVRNEGVTVRRCSWFVLSVTIAVIMSLLAAGSASAASVKIDEPNLAYSSDELIAGVFFGSGPVATKLDTTFDPTSIGISPDEHERNVVHGLAFLKRSDPGLYERTAHALTSGDVLRIDSALREMGSAISKHAQNQTRTQATTPSRCGAVGAVCVAVAYVGAVSWVVAQSSLAVTSVAYAWQALYGPGVKYASLENERVVAAAADRLAL